MADYIYLLENRLSAAQRAALRTLRELARSKALTIFLVGGAVRDLTSGSPVRDLDVVVQGNALKLKKDLEKLGAVIAGEYDLLQALYVRFPGNVRVEVGSTVSVSFPKPGKAAVKPSTILDDLRRRDFTANAMALSLNEGSYGLLMDPLNGVADIENRELRLVSNYGFIEDPVRMIRAARLMARLGWAMDERTQTRYENGQIEGYISAMTEHQRGYELEEIVHEEDPLRVLRRLETDGWMKFLAPFWNSAKANAPELDRLRETLAQLQMQGIHPDTAAVQFPLITAKLSAAECASLKSSFPRRGFVQEIDGLEAEVKEFATQLGGKAAALPSQAWKMMMAARPEVVLALAHSTKSAALLAKFKSFFTEWPQARQKMPYALMQEMRITPELAEYDTLLENLFFELMDGRLTTVEEMKAYLEPYSPPAPPPPVNARRARAAKKDAKPAKARARKALKLDDLDADVAEEDAVGSDADEGEGPAPDLDQEAVDLDPEADESEAAAPELESDSDDEEEEESIPAPAARVSSKPGHSPRQAAPPALSAAPVVKKGAAVPAASPAKPAVVPPKKGAPPAPAPKVAEPRKPTPETARKSAAPPRKIAPAKPVTTKAAAKKVAVAKKPVAVKVTAKAPKAAVKAAATKAKPAAKAKAKKAVAKAPAKVAAKSKTPAKAAAKTPAKSAKGPAAKTKKR